MQALFPLGDEFEEPDPVKQVVDKAMSEHQQVLKDKQARQSKRFKWTEQLQRLFALEVAKVGLKNIKPKYIQQKFFKYGLQNSNIGSHLQKFKLRVQKEYHLDSFDQFENWMGLREYENDPEISRILEE